MDALPGAENMNLLFSSTIEGKMYVCERDAHMAIVLRAAHFHSEGWGGAAEESDRLE